MPRDYSNKAAEIIARTKKADPGKKAPGSVPGKDKAQNEHKTERLSFLANKEVMEALNDLSNLYLLRGEKINGRKPTTNMLLNIAVADYLAKHQKELDEYRKLRGAAK